MVDKIEVFISYAQEDEETIPFRGQTERLLKEASSFCSARDYSQWCLTLG